MKGVAPDIVCFGKKAQICGIYASNRIDEVPNNVFAVPSRINSTWGGDLVDMVRCRRFIEIIEGEDLAGKVADRGDQLLKGLRSLAREQGSLENVRGVGSMVAFDMEGPEVRKATLRALYAQKVLALPTGKRGIRFRLPFVIQPREIDEILNRLSASLPVRT
jgi:L-lysine 6-transaminase